MSPGGQDRGTGGQGQWGRQTTTHEQRRLAACADYVCVIWRPSAGTGAIRRCQHLAARYNYPVQRSLSAPPGSSAHTHRGQLAHQLGLLSLDLLRSLARSGGRKVRLQVHTAQRGAVARGAGGRTRELVRGGQDMQVRMPQRLASTHLEPVNQALHLLAGNQLLLPLLQWLASAARHGSGGEQERAEKAQPTERRRCWTHVSAGMYTNLNVVPPMLLDANCGGRWVAKTPSSWSHSVARLCRCINCSLRAPSRR